MTWLRRIFRLRHDDIRTVEHLTPAKPVFNYDNLVVIHGERGTGKTHLVMMLGKPQPTKTLRKSHPLNGEFLLYLLLSKNDSKATANDLEERWGKIKKKFGVRRANFWYWTQVIRSLWPFGVAAAKRVSGLVALIEAWRRLRG